MSRSVVAKTIAVLVTVVLMSGCASGPKKPTDEEMIRGQLEALKTAVLAKNLDKIMAVVSDSFYHPEVGDKQAAKNLVQEGISSGVLDSGQVDLTKVQIKIDNAKGTATAYPIVASAPMGSVTVNLTLKKEKGVWLVTGGDAEGV